MQIKIGTAGVPTAASSTLEGIAYNHKIGLHALEVEFVHGVNMGDELAKKAGQAAKENNISLSVHAPYYINLCNPEKLDDSKKRILDSCEKAGYLGANVVVFHPGFYSKLSRDEAFEMVLRACIDMESVLKKSKNHVHMGLETTGRKSQFGELDEIIEICKKCRSCVPVVDFSHIYARSGGKIDYNEIFSALKNLNLDHLHSHFSGIEFSDKGERKHLPIGKHPDYKEFVKKVIENQMSITIINESPLIENDCMKLKKEFESHGYAFK